MMCICRIIKYIEYMHMQWRMKCSVLMQQTFILDFSFIVVWIHRNWRERYRELRCSSCPPPTHSLPYCRCLPQKLHFLQRMNHKDVSPSALVLAFCRCGQVYNDTCPLVPWSRVLPWTSSVSHPFPLKPLAPTDLSVVFMVLSFLECHTVAIMQCVGLSECLFHLVMYI